MRLAAALFCVVAIGLTHVAPAAAEVTLRRSVLVDDRFITLGDIFEGLPAELAETRVAHAPSPGKKTFLDAKHLSMLSLRFKLRWRPLSRFERAEVRRRSLVVDRQTLKRAVVEELTNRIEGVEEFSIQLDQRNVALHLPADANPVLRVDSLDFDARKSRFVATVSAAEIARQTRHTQVTLSGRVFEMTEIPVLRRDIPRNEVIKSADVAWKKVPAQRLRGGVVRDKADLTGMSVRRSLRAGSMLRPDDLQPAVIVPKGNQLTIFLVHGNMQLSVQGKALEDGSAGEVIRVQNSQSRRTVEARVVGPDRVVVGMPDHVALRQ